MIPGIKIFTDASTIPEIRGYAAEPWISGFTTNPTLMRKGGVTDYRAFALEAIEAAAGKPLSLEVVADDLPTMQAQGLLLGSWGANVNVKIPITTTIADSGVDPVPLMTKYCDWLKDLPKAELLWASPREVLNIVQASACGCDIITVTPDVLKKLDLIGKDLGVFSLETVRMFYDDALSAGLDII